MPSLFVSQLIQSFKKNCWLNSLFITSACSKKQKSPRVLSCLHVLCEICVKDLLEFESEESSENAIFAARKKTKTTITCPMCKQETAVMILYILIIKFNLITKQKNISIHKVGERGLSSLQLDPIFLKRSASDSNLSGLICTSCKANEEAVAKCMDCDNLLCSICTTAHRVCSYLTMTILFIW